MLGAIVLLLVPKEQRRTFELGALAVTVADFLLSVPLWFQYDRTTAAVQWVTKLDWIPSIGVKFSIGMDGISLVLFLLTTFIGFIGLAIPSFMLALILMYFGFTLFNANIGGLFSDEFAEASSDMHAHSNLHRRASECFNSQTKFIALRH